MKIKKILADELKIVPEPTVRSEITKKSVNLMEYSADRGYHMIIGAVPENLEELMKNGGVINNVMLTLSSPFNFVYAVARLVKGFSKVNKVEPLDTLKIIEEYFEEEKKNGEQGKIGE